MNNLFILNIINNIFNKYNNIIEKEELYIYKSKNISNKLKLNYLFIFNPFHILNIT